MNNIKFIHFEELPSTNTYALENINEFENGTIIVAKKQTNGRGRFNRTWESQNPENLYFSIILKPTIDLNTNLPLANITQYMSLILCKTLELYNANAEIKWPNDVLILGKKISGILAETSIKQQKLQGLVLGVGINLNSCEKELAEITQPATSLNIEIQKNIDKEIFLTQLIDLFFKNYDEFLSQGFPSIKQDYEQKCFFIGKDIKIKDHNQTYTAKALCINENGTLNVKTNDFTQDITTGDIFCL